MNDYATKVINIKRCIKSGALRLYSRLVLTASPVGNWKARVLQKAGVRGLSSLSDVIFNNSYRMSIGVTGRRSNSGQGGYALPFSGQRCHPFSGAPACTNRLLTGASY